MAAMPKEARLKQTPGGKVPEGDGWFVLNAREARWLSGDFGAYTRFEGEERWHHLGVNIGVLQPGQPACYYHGEADQEDFLVLSGECLLLIEGQERRLKAWDFVHCPPWTEHVFVGAGDGPCAVLAVGSRAGDQTIYPEVRAGPAPRRRGQARDPGAVRGLRRDRRRRRYPLPGRLAPGPLMTADDWAGAPSWSPVPTPGSAAPPPRHWPPAGATVYMACRTEAKARPVRDAIATATGNDRPPPAVARPRRPGFGASVRRRVLDDRSTAARARQQRRTGRQARDDRQRLRAGLRHQPCRARSC